MTSSLEESDLELQAVVIEPGRFVLVAFIGVWFSLPVPLLFEGLEICVHQVDAFQKCLLNKHFYLVNASKLL